MKKRLCTLLLALALLCTLLPWSALEARAETYNGTCGENVTWSLDTETGLLEIKGSGPMGDLDEVDFQEELPWNKYRNQIRKIVIHEGVTRIGHLYLSCLDNVVSISIPNSVSSIGAMAFYYDTSLVDIEIPDGTECATYCMFYNCTSLQTFRIPDGVTELDYETFGNCTGLRKVIFPESVTSIDSYAFDNCSKDLTFYGTAGSAVEAYAKNHGFRFVNIGTPDIVSHPAAKRANLGELVTFEVRAEGENLTYQWQYSKDNGATWGDWLERTDPVFTVKASKTNNGCLYRCAVTNNNGTAYSHSARLTVRNAPPLIVVQPKHSSVDLGKKVTFKTVAGGSDLRYQWYFSKDNGQHWYAWAGKTDYKLTVTGSATNGGCCYRCVVRNAYGKVYSVTARLTVN